MDICRASASSDAIRSSVEPAVARRVEVLFEALAESLQQAQNDALQELLETVLVFAAESMEDEPDAQHSLLVWAASLGLDLAPIAVHEDDDEDLVPIVEPDSVPTRKKPPPRRPPAQHAYHRERLEDLVAEAIATGMQKTRARLVRGRIEIMGQHPKRGDVHLKWLKTSMQEAESLVLQVNQEIQKVEAP